jgi:hypothetical protein
MSLGTQLLQCALQFQLDGTTELTFNPEDCA